MSKARVTKLLIVAAVAATAALPIVQAQQTQPPPQQPAQAPPGGAQQGPPPEPKNLVVLKGMSRPQVMQVMREWTAALGVECSFCHQAPYDTETPRKHVARLMHRDYVAGAKHKDGSAVSCKDCHQGQPNPLRTQPFAAALGRAAAPALMIPADKVMDVMQEFTKALGVKCDYCHVPGKFADETPRKQIARFMMTEFSGKLTKADGSAMSCNDCHQGHALPLAKLPFPRRPQQQQQQPAPAQPPGEKRSNE
jgi:nitrate/TMAO reductase-like tetraheme cytochrome c subunit